jgi:cell division septum initiation protein DivIVA
MPQEPIVVLEERVHQLLELVKRLKQENAQLQERVKQAGQQLAKKEGQAVRWAHDRTRLRAKVQRLLDEVEVMIRTKARSGSGE